MKLPTNQPRRALFLAGRDPLHPRAAGGDLQAWQWATFLSRNGWDVEFVAQRVPGRPELETVEGVSVLRFPGPLLTWHALRHYRRNAASINLVYEDPIGAGRAPYFAPLYSRVTVIAVWHQVSASLLGTLNSRWVATGLSLAERLIARLYRKCLLWAPSRESADAVSGELGIPRERIFVIPPTLAEGIPIASAPADPTQDILCMGLIRPYKNFEHVIEAMSLVHAESPEARLIIAGRHSDATYEEFLSGEVTRLGLDGVVDFRFNISDAERQDLMRSSATLVLPSLLEGFGIVSIEANAEGTPVVASSGVPVAAVGDEENGLRFEFGNVRELANCLSRILHEEGLRTRLGTEGLRHARGLVVDAVGPRFLELVDRATGSR